MSQGRHQNLTLALQMVGVGEVSKAMVLSYLPVVVPSLPSMVTSRVDEERERKEECEDLSVSRSRRQVGLVQNAKEASGWRPLGMSYIQKQGRVYFPLLPLGLLQASYINQQKSSAETHFVNATFRY